MKGYELGWVEVLILLLVVVLGVAAFSFYYAGIAINYAGTPILVMQLVTVIIQLVVLSVLFRMYAILEEEKKSRKSKK